jgi:P4 family phage/plasmid primase-like protien
MPYSLAAQHYFDAGWSPIPLPYKEKSPVPDDTTGGTAPYVTAEQVGRWLGKSGRWRGKPERARAGNLSYLPGNVALRMPPNVIGIDVDLYGGKAGAETLATAEERWGALPPTWISTSRLDGSGIRYFVVPEGLKWKDVGPGVETIKWYHRYAIVFPSIHDKTLKRYYWIKPDGSSTGLTNGEVEFPSIDELPMLPAAWVAGLTGGESYTGSGDAGDIDYDSAKLWLEDNGIGDICNVMSATLTKYSRLVREAGEDGGAHDQARNGAWAILGDAGLGHSGGSEAIRQLGAVFLTAVAGRRDGTGEWRRAVIKGVGKVREEQRKAGIDSLPDDPCDMFADAPAKPAQGAGRTAVGSDTFDWERDDIGNAQRLQRAVGGYARWVDAWQSWVMYDEQTSMWDRIRGNAMMTREAINVVRRMGEEAKFIEDAESLKAFKSWVKTSGNVQRLDAMMKVARVMGGMPGRAEEYDAEWNHLHVANGVVILGDDEVTFRARRLEDMATLASPVSYDPKAKSALWDRFLREVLPDKETRLWVQKLVGSSLLGGNPDRSMVIGIGPTTSGKSTFVEVLANVLGAYAATYNLQMFREKRDEGPRVDLLNALAKRFLYTVEASPDVVLHVDSIKRMTGGDRLTARGMGSNVYVEAVPAFTPWLMCNEPPSVPGADAALRRRLKVAPFAVSLDPAKVDPTLKPRLCAPTELPGILAWAVEGWNLYKAEGLEGPGLEVVEATFEVRESLSLLDAWMRACCEPGGEYFERTEDLHSSYVTWLEMNHEEDKRHASLSAFGRALTANNYPKARKYIDGVQTMVRFGLQLRRIGKRS